MNIAKFLKEKRIEKGMSDVEFSNMIRLDVCWVGDLESYEDELDTLSISRLKRICKVLGIHPADIFRAVASDLNDLSLSALIKRRREEKGYSIEELANRIGYETVVIEALENNKDLDNVPGRRNGDGLKLFK